MKLPGLRRLSSARRVRLGARFVGWSLSQPASDISGGHVLGPETGVWAQTGSNDGLGKEVGLVCAFLGARWKRRLRESSPGQLGGRQRPARHRRSRLQRRGTHK